MGVLIAGLVIGAIFGAVIVSGIAVTMLQPLPFDNMNIGEGESYDGRKM